MARTDNLSNYLVDVANAIREKTGETEAIRPNEFDEKIKNISSGTVSMLPVYEQLTEPKEKNGVWLKTSDKAENIYISNVRKLTDLSNIPYNFDTIYATITATKNDIYLLGSNSNSKYMYKYNTLTDEYTKLTDLPYTITSYNAVVEAIGTDIYILKFNDYGYKYDTINDTYTQLPKATLYHASSTVIRNNIYAFGGNSNGDNRASKYDTTNNTITGLAVVPYSFKGGYAMAVGNDIYLAGGENSASYIYKYSVNNNTYTEQPQMPAIYKTYNGIGEAIGTDLYIIGGSGSANGYAYYDLACIYNTISNQYSLIYEDAFNVYGSKSAKVNGDVYIIKSTEMRKYGYSFAGKDISNSVCLGINYNILNNNMDIIVNKVEKYKNGSRVQVEAYVGDGSTWKRIN